MNTTITEAVIEMLAIVKRLNLAFPHKAFTLDGRLVGDIGEILVAEIYDLKLFEGITKHHDAECPDGRLVQIKATMKNSLTFPADHIPLYYIGIKIHPDGTFDEIFNGPGEIAGQAVKNRAVPKTNLHSVTTSALAKLQKTVPSDRKIPKRNTNI